MCTILGRTWLGWIPLNLGMGGFDWCQWRGIQPRYLETIPLYSELYHTRNVQRPSPISCFFPLFSFIRRVFLGRIGCCFEWVFICWLFFSIWFYHNIKQLHTELAAVRNSMRSRLHRLSAFVLNNKYNIGLMCLFPFHTDDTFLTFFSSQYQVYWLFVHRLFVASYFFPVVVSCSSTLPQCSAAN